MHFYRRRLPHFSSQNQPVFLTWRLHGSLPAHRFFSPEHLSSGRAFLTMDRLLDSAATGPLFLKIPALASLVEEAILYRQTQLNHYDLHAYVVMANHIHLLITPHQELPTVLQSLKRFTAVQCNRLLHQTGQPFWQEEAFDRLVRNNSEFTRITRYIETNPVTAGLVSSPEAFPWSSANKHL